MKLNLPNKITISRILLTPIVIFIYLSNFIPFNKIIASVIFILAVSTDFIDGKVARKYNLVSSLGKFLDPIADKLINVSAILLICANNVLPSPFGVLFAIIIISRELLIGALRQIGAVNGKVIAADKLGKLKTVMQDIAIPLLMVLNYLQDKNLINYNLVSGGGLAIFSNIILVLAYLFTLISTILTVWSLGNYFVKNKHVITE